MELLDRLVANGTVWDTDFGTVKDKVVVWDRVGTIFKRNQTA